MSIFVNDIRTHTSFYHERKLLAVSETIDHSVVFNIYYCDVRIMYNFLLMVPNDLMD